MNRVPVWLITLVFAVAFLGFLDASFLTFEHYLNATPPCFITQGCDTVTTSSYSKIVGIPVSLLGALYYLVIMVVWLLYVDRQNQKALDLMPWLTAMGFLFSLWLVSAQVFIIHALCMYCLISAGTSTTLFILALVTLKYKKDGKVAEI